MRMVTLPDGASVPAIGQGTWEMGDDPSHAEREQAALLAGLHAGARLIDTAEMYGAGASEQLVGRTLAQVERAGIPRKEVFLVSKVLPEHAGRARIFDACAASLQRLGTDYLDLYLLHWRGGTPLAETVACLEELVAEGRIRRWGVSNFDADDMRELISVPGSERCAVNQVLYHVASRGIEHELLPWMRAHGIPAMAYCPLAQSGRLRAGLFEHPVLTGIARARRSSVAQVLLAFAIRTGDIIAIPKSVRAERAQENAAAAALTLTPDELAAIDAAFPAPTGWTPLDVV